MTIMDARFDPSQRLHDARDFSRVFNRQQKAAGRFTVLLLRPRERTPPSARIGVMVPNKTVKTAVRRHQLKRWVRECFRLRLRHALAGHDAVVLFRCDPPENSHPAIDAELLSLAAKALAAKPQPQSGRRGGFSAPSRPSSP